MEVYTKEQLISAQKQWNEDRTLNPDNYEPMVDCIPEDWAERQIDHLLSFIK